MTTQVLLEVTDLIAGYGAIEVLHQVSLTVGRGEVVSIVGANGAGKSTLINTISGIVRPRAGSVCLSGQPLNRLAPAKICASASTRPPARSLVASSRW